VVFQDIYWEGEDRNSETIKLKKSIRIQGPDFGASNIICLNVFTQGRACMPS
jgi:hypothetical protein